MMCLRGGKHQCGCYDCVCERCGCRDMRVCCKNADEKNGGSCILWAFLILLTGGLALIFPLFCGNGTRRADSCAMVCGRCGHVQYL